MALRRTIAKHLAQNQTPAISKPLTATNSYIHRELLTSPQKPSPTTADVGFFRRFLHRRKFNQSSTLSLPELIGAGLRISATERKQVCEDSIRISVNEARRVSLMKNVRSALKRISTNWISYSEFVNVCIGSCSDEEVGLELSKMLDEGGDVIVLGNVVFLRPHQLAKSMEELISQSITIPNDPRKQQLEELERQKSFIDQKSLSQVRGELYCGLGFLIIQTLVFMRLTFWELSWDVMEPICFFVTSFHFALAYMFFIKTSKEPTFEGYFQRRFKTKQRKLMEAYGFDLKKYNELCTVFYPTRVLGMSSFQVLDRGGSLNLCF